MKTQVKAFAGKPDDLSWVPETPMLEGKSQLLKIVLSSSKVSSDLCALLWGWGAAPEQEWGWGAYKPWTSPPEIGRSWIACLLSSVPPTPGGHVAWYQVTSPLIRPVAAPVSYVRGFPPHIAGICRKALPPQQFNIPPTPQLNDSSRWSCVLGSVLMCSQPPEVSSRPILSHPPN